MKLLTVVKNNRFTGVQYEHSSPDIWEHHLPKGESLIYLDYRLAPRSDGTYDELSEDQLSKVFTDKAVYLVERRVQSVVDLYNQTNKVDFVDIHACANYANNTGYTHQKFCVDVWNWNVNVWEAARRIIAEVESGQREEPTAEEFVSMLPDYTGVF